MQLLFDIMPGITMPVSEVTHFLSNLWLEDVEATDELNRYQACQMNVILHLGRATTPEHALHCFDTTIELAQKYPCRIIVLCPQSIQEKQVVLESKIFSRCFLGSDLKDMRCCEALILGYLIEESHFLEDQVSIFLKDDLPTYYWINQVRTDGIRERYRPFIESCNNVIYDSSLESSDFLKLPWKNPNHLKDLAWSRLLPIRQCVGQFLGGYPPKRLVDGLQSITVSYSPSYEAEAKDLLLWQTKALSLCNGAQAIPSSLVLIKDDPTHCLETQWTYSNANHFKFSYCSQAKTGIIEAHLGEEFTTLSLKISPSNRSETLASAIFF